MRWAPGLLFSVISMFSAILLSCSEDSVTPTKTKIKPVVYELLATDEDGISISVKANQTVSITSTDSVNTNPGGPVVDCDLWTDADGILDCQYVTDDPLCRGLPFMALIGTCGADSFLIGTKFDSTFASACTLTFVVNDWVFTDNDGRFRVSVLLK
jgi:hypothetical protein